MRHSKPWSESCERELPSNCELGTRLALAQARAAENLRITWWIWWILWTRIYKTYQNINWPLVLTADIHISQGLNFLLSAFRLRNLVQKSEYCNYVILYDLHWCLLISRLGCVSFARSILSKPVLQVYSGGRLHFEFPLLVASYRKVKIRRWSQSVAQRGLQEFNMQRGLFHPFPIVQTTCAFY